MSSATPPSGFATEDRIKVFGPGYEPFAGYRLEKQIGRGGFGEVWQANAPGDLKKAIKFVFGQHDSAQALRELRSLERIRSVRHPFLLTLERFEIVDGRLVIVTELADGSLEDIYRRHRDAGSCGIPRRPLLKNLLDTADGLDYLHGEFGLQHLDIKPANLLLIGGHIKVADFGLLKDLQDTDCSIVGGLTPIYAPPELFDGRPSMHSDQYSLAVMYQELLTGTRPFAGRTIAQLATQHVHSPPNLEPLPPRDRAIIARSLEKDPSKRFDSCCDLIAALMSDKQPTIVPAPQPTLPEIHDLPGIDSSESNQKDETFGTGPKILIVALGGTGAKVVQRLGSLMKDSEDGTTMDVLMIDTDSASLRDLSNDSSLPSGMRIKTLHLPIRTASEYRSAPANQFRSISRRWIYNVPRSGATEGIRPIGRLALVDRGQHVQEAIQAAVRLIQSSPTSQTQRQQPPRVYVVGSLAGGTGSGIYIDVVHQLRHWLDFEGHANAEILSLLSCPPLRGGDGDRLLTHNAHAALIEVEHFLQARNGYCGDQGAGFVAVPAARTPLQNLYLVGAENDTAAVRKPVETISQYLWTASHDAHDLLCAARRTDSDSTITVPRPAIRSVGIVLLSDPGGSRITDLAMAVVRDLLGHWLGSPRTAASRSTAVVAKIRRRVGLTPQYMFGTLLQTVDSKEHSRPGSANSQRLSGERGNGSPDFIAAAISNQLQREYSIHLGDFSCDITTLIETADQLASVARNLSTEFANSDGALRQQCGSRLNEVLELSAAPIQKLIEEFQYLGQRLECLAAITAVAAFEMDNQTAEQDTWSKMPTKVIQQRPALMSKLHDLTINQHLVRSLNDPNSNLNPAVLVAGLTEAALPLAAAVLQTPRQPDVSDSDREAVESDKLSANDSVLAFAGGAVHSPAEKSRWMANQIPSSDADSTEPVRSLYGMNGHSGDQPCDVPSVQAAIGFVRPDLMDFGGSQRLLLLVPNQQQLNEFEPQIRECIEGNLSVAQLDLPGSLLVQEVQQIELRSLIARLEVIGGDRQVTARLASRNDVSFGRP